jgi:hypothetical protein
VRRCNVQTSSADHHNRGPQMAGYEYVPKRYSPTERTGLFRFGTAFAMTPAVAAAESKRAKQKGEVSGKST